MIAFLPAAALLISAAQAAARHVVRVDPAASEIPATILRLYVTFDAPARGRVRQSDVRLLDADGRPIAGAFMDFGQELWSPDGRRLTILFDPGRVKRDVEGEGESAAPLSAGQHYTIVIGAYRQDITVGPPERRPLDPQAWAVSAPVAGSRAPAAVTFDRVMDAGLLADQLGVVDAGGAPVAGRAMVAAGDRVWQFQPARPWPTGAYWIVVGTALEDVSGNRISEALDHSVDAPGAGPTGAVLPFTVAATPSALTSAPPPAACAPHIFRFDDDCRGIATLAERHGLDRLRHIPLAGDAAWLTIGGEIRVRLENFDPNVGIAPNDRGYFSQAVRGILNADLRTRSGWRLFAQLAAGGEAGRLPAERPFDRSGPDVQQLFAEVPIGHAITLRLGRQELDLGGSRLVGARDQANLRLAFDMARAEARLGPLTATAFWGRPVVNQPGSFDDTAPAREAFYGITLRGRPLIAGMPATIDLLLLGRDRAKAIYYDAAGADRRRTASMRAAGAIGQADYQLNASYQFGRVGSADVSAYGLLLSGGYTVRSWPWKPRLGLDLGLASGDRRRGDGQLNSFDPLYPNLGYFSDAPVDYPTNWQGIEPGLTLNPAPTLSVRFGSVIRFVNSRADGLYAPSGQGFLPPDRNGGGFADTASFVHATWRASRYLQIDAGLVHGGVGALVRARGGHDFDFGLLQASFRF